MNMCLQVLLGRRNRPETLWSHTSGRLVQCGFAKDDLDVVEVEFNLTIAKIVFQVEGG